MKNAVGREIPELIPGIKTVKPYQGPFATIPAGRMYGPKIRASKPRSEKVLKSLDQVVEAAGIRDGMTISFHHHLRNGDFVMAMVVDALARRGIKGLTLAASSLPSVQDALVPYVEQGVITAIDTSGLRDKLGALVQSGKLETPAMIRTHGGRARAIESGELHIDVAFIAAPACDTYGNINGVDGKSACGSLGYAMVDAAYADQVVAVTDNLVPYPLFPVSIPQTQVDFIVPVDCIGDPGGISTGSLRVTKDPRELMIAEWAAKAIEHSGLFNDGFSVQMGSGGSSLAVARFIGETMRERGFVSGFSIGGVTGVLVNLLEEGLIGKIFDAQTFDVQSIQSLRNNPGHKEISASYYANPHNCGAAVNNLDVVVLSATEIDVDFNVNVLTNSHGQLMGAPGGHPDTAAGANMSIVVAPLLRGRLPMILDRVTTVVTPGETVDVVVTERGIAVNPRRPELFARFKDARLPVYSIEELRDMAYALVGKPDPVQAGGRVVALVEYRDGTIIDVVRGF
jgi:citrate lyase subunit alpha/citrate CoA-transferase